MIQLIDNVERSKTCQVVQGFTKKKKKKKNIN